MSPKEERNRSNGQSIYLFLLNYVIRFCKYIAKDEIIVIATHPKAQIYYQAILPFKFISKDIKYYKMMNSAPAFGQYIDHLSVTEELIHRFEIAGKNKFYKFFFENKYDNFIWPKQCIYNSPISILSPEEISDIFEKKSSTMKSSTSASIKKLTNMYDLGKYKEYLNKYENENSKNKMKRSNPRFHVCLEGMIEPENTSFRIVDISEDGLQIALKEKIEMNDDYLNIKIFLENINDSIDIKTRIIWNSKNLFGLKIFHLEKTNGEKWRKVINYLHQRFEEAS